MELRSGSVISSGTPFTSAEQARAACLGQARVQLQAAHRPPFEAAVRGVLSRWTALRLAIENGWAGDETDDKASQLEHSILGWFYSPGDHYADELEDHLDDFLVEELHVECEDGSPAEVSNLLVHVFELCARGDASLASQLAQAPAPVSAVEQSQRDGPTGNGAGPHSATAAQVTPDDLAAAMGGMMNTCTPGGGDAMGEEEPLEDGWERVPTRSGRRR